MRVGTVVLRDTDAILAALKSFKQDNATMLPVADAEMLCKGWLRLDFALDGVGATGPRVYIERTILLARARVVVAERGEVLVADSPVDLAQNRVGAVGALDGAVFVPIPCEFLLLLRWWIGRWLRGRGHVRVWIVAKGR